MAKSNGNGNGRTSLRLFDYTDRELLLVVMEYADADPDGYASTQDIADALGMGGDHRLNAVGSRLAAMRRLGAIEKEPDAPISRWAVSPIGRAMASGRMKAAAEKQLENLGPEQLLLLTRFLTTRWREAPDTASHLIRREWMAGTNTRR